MLYSVACENYILRLSYGLILLSIFFVLTAGRRIDSIDVIDRFLAGCGKTVLGVSF